MVVIVAIIVGVVLYLKKKKRQQVQGNAPSVGTVATSEWIAASSPAPDVVAASASDAALMAPVVAASAPVVAASAPVVAASAPVVAASAPVVAASAPVAAASAPVASAHVVAASAPVVEATASPTPTAAAYLAWQGQPLSKFVASRDASGQDVYACRAQFQNTTQVGQTMQGWDHCSVAFGSEELKLAPFEMLDTNKSLMWGSAASEFDVVGGNEPWTGNLYVCRAPMNGSVGVGKTGPKWDSCWIGAGGASHGVKEGVQWLQDRA